MPVIQINNVLGHLKATAIATVDGMHHERVWIGPADLRRLVNGPIISILTDGNDPERIDGDGMRRRVSVTIGLLLAIDPIKGDADIQINELYEPLHAALEAMRDGVAGTFEQMVEVAGSLKYDTALHNEVPLRTVQCDWEITFDRTLGSTQ